MSQQHKIEDITKTVWTVPDGAHAHQENLILSCLMRMATAQEVMAKNYLLLQADVEYYKGRTNHFKTQYQALIRQNIALRGVITRMKNKQKQAPPLSPEETIPEP